MADIALVITRTLNVSPEAVFDAWTDPTQVALWYGPEGFTNTIHEFDLKVGGTYRLTMHGPKGENHPLRGTFKIIERPSKLVLTWQWESPDGLGAETLVTVELKMVGEKCEMTMTHEGFADEKQKAMHDQGWSSSFSKLQNLFS